jgi:hypothetical protein
MLNNKMAGECQRTSPADPSVARRRLTVEGASETSIVSCMVRHVDARGGCLVAWTPDGNSPICPRIALLYIAAASPNTTAFNFDRFFGITGGSLQSGESNHSLITSGGKH